MHSSTYRNRIRCGPVLALPILERPNQRRARGSPLNPQEVRVRGFRCALSPIDLCQHRRCRTLGSSRPQMFHCTPAAIETHRKDRYETAFAGRLRRRSACRACRTPPLQRTFGDTAGILRPRDDEKRSHLIFRFGDNEIAEIARVQPELLIISRCQPHIANMRRSGVEIGETMRERGRQVLIKQEPRWRYRGPSSGSHAATSPASRRSRSAAKASAARISSRSKSGKSARISSSDIPPAK